MGRFIVFIMLSSAMVFSSFGIAPLQNSCAGGEERGVKVVSEIAPRVSLKVQKSDSTAAVIPAKFERIGEDTFRIVVKKEDISPQWRQLRIVTPLTVANAGDNGCWFASDGRMGYFKHGGDGRMLMRKNPMPIFGFLREGSGVLVRVRGLRHDFGVQVDAVNGKYDVYPRFFFGKDFIPYEDIVVDYKIFEGQKANYSQMARSYREELLKSAVVVPLAERAKENPVLSYAVQSPFIKVIMGAKHNSKKIADQTPENEPKVSVYRTFDDVVKLMEALSKMGVKEANLCLTGWQKGGHDGCYPTIFPVEEAMGGEEGMRRAIKRAEELGYRICAHVCHDDAYTVSPLFDIADICKKRDLTPVTGAIMAGGLSYKMCYMSYYNKFLSDEIKGMKSLGVNGGYHVDVTSAIVPRPCFDKRHFCTSEDTSMYMKKIGERLRKEFGMFSSESSMDNLAEVLDNALYVAMPPQNSADSPLIDGYVPIWQIVYHGIILSNPFYATIDYNYKKTKVHEKKIALAMGGMQKRRLILIEFGGRPTYYNELNIKNLAPVKEAYDLYKKLRHLQYEFIDEHVRLAEGVYLTRYSNGSRTVVNYGKKPFDYNGIEVKAEDFVLVEK